MPDLRELIGEALGAQDDLGVTDVVLTKFTPGTRTIGQQTGGKNPAPSHHPARGFAEKTGKFSDGTLVKEKHALISIFGSTISGGVEPEEGDSILFNGARYSITRVGSDPVGAVFECEALRT